jgi:cytochrome c peroxidase
MSDLQLKNNTMKKTKLIIALVFTNLLLFINCSKDSDSVDSNEEYQAVTTAFGTNIDPNNLANYANQTIPNYIRKDNTNGNTITNAKATLGRVLFYDRNLSTDNSISCSSCHKQETAFSDTALASDGVNGGLTGRHSMRLINARFSIEAKFFWDERAATLETQTTMPIQDHAEMGFSGKDGRPNLSTLLTKLQGITYYNELFKFVYGDVAVTETRLQECLAQFVRSIQSFDSKFDIGRAQVANNNQNFPNYTTQENTGKNLFLTPPVFDATGNRTSGGLGCNACHAAPEFDIDSNTKNNGIIGVLNGTGFDLTNTRSPSLRDLTNTSGVPNTPMMHTGVITSLQAAIGHYGNINANPANTNLDPRLKPNGFGQQLHLNANEVDAVIAFIKTLAGTNVYIDHKWSDPFKK